jgi:hypothetical protein
MATKNKKLSRAKAEGAFDAINTLLEGTEHDDRLSYGLRNILINTNLCLETLVMRLREDERNAR